LSTMTFCENTGVSFCAMSRAAMSVLPPGG
jgi:hypothetical protein